MRRLSRRERVGAGVLSVLALCLLTLDLGGSSLSAAHSGVRGTLGALYRGTDTVLGPARRFVQGVPHAASDEAQVHELQHRNAALRKRLADTAADDAATADLSRLQLAANSLDERVLPARVTATSPGEGFDWTVTVDVGSSSGVRVGQSVTDGLGLVGRVLHADGSSAVVLLAVDPGSGAGARDVRNGELGVATGDGSGGLTFVPRNPDAMLRAGDRLVTGPSSATSFVPDLAVGAISAVRVSSDGTVRASVTPSASATELDLVGIVLRGGRVATTRAPLVPLHQSAPDSSNLAGGR